MITQTAGKCVLSISSTSDHLPTSSAFYPQPSPQPSPQSSQPQLPAAPAGVSGAAVGGAIAALLILAVFAAAGVAIMIVVLVRRRNVQKSTNVTCTFSPCDLDDKQVDRAPMLDQPAEQMELQQNTCYAPSGSYKHGDLPAGSDQYMLTNV